MTCIASSSVYSYCMAQATLEIGNKMTTIANIISTEDIVAIVLNRQGGFSQREIEAWEMPLREARLDIANHDASVAFHKLHDTKISGVRRLNTQGKVQMVTAHKGERQTKWHYTAGGDFTLCGYEFGNLGGHVAEARINVYGPGFCKTCRHHLEVGGGHS